jgi:hypothetical protein
MAPDTEPVEFIEAYVSNYDVRCGVCRFRRLHRNGGWVRCADGRIVLCGVDCCQDIPGGEIARKIRAGVERIKRTKARARVIAPFVDGVPEVLDQLDYWIPEEIALESIISRLIFSTSSFDFGFRLDREVSEAGTIDRVRIEPFIDRGRRQERRVLLGRTNAATVLAMADRSLAKAGKKLSMIAEKAAAPKHDERTLALINSARSGAISCLLSGVRRFELAKKFFERENIEELAKWFSTEIPDIRLQWSSDRPTILVSNKASHFGQINDEIPIPRFSELPTVRMLVDPLRRREAA